MTQTRLQIRYIPNTVASHISVKIKNHNWLILIINHCCTQ